MPRFTPAVIASDQLRSLVIDFTSDINVLTFNYDGEFERWGRLAAQDAPQEDIDQCEVKCKNYRKKLTTLRNKLYKTNLELNRRAVEELRFSERLKRSQRLPEA